MQVYVVSRLSCHAPQFLGQVSWTGWEIVVHYKLGRWAFLARNIYSQTVKQRSFFCILLIGMSSLNESSCGGHLGVIEPCGRSALPNQSSIRLNGRPTSRLRGRNAITSSKEAAWRSPVIIRAPWKWTKLSTVPLAVVIVKIYHKSFLLHKICSFDWD